MTTRNPACTLRECRAGDERFIYTLCGGEQSYLDCITGLSTQLQLDRLDDYSDTMDSGRRQVLCLDGEDTPLALAVMDFATPTACTLTIHGDGDAVRDVVLFWLSQIGVSSVTSGDVTWDLGTFQWGGLESGLRPSPFSFFCH